MDEILPTLTGKARCWWGAIGGSIAVGSKYIAQDHNFARAMIDTHSYNQIPGLIFFYAVLLVVLCITGAAVAVASGENNKLKLLAIAVSAPAIITTWLGGARADIKPRPTQVAFVSSAFAADTSATQPSGFWQGFLLPLGFGKDDSRYQVIAGSFSNKTDAAQAVARFQKQFPDQTVFVGEPQPGNPYYSVTVGGYVPYSEAKQTLEAVRVTKPDAYLSTYKWR